MGGYQNYKDIFQVIYLTNKLIKHLDVYSLPRHPSEPIFSFMFKYDNNQRIYTIV